MPEEHRGSWEGGPHQQGRFQEQDLRHQQQQRRGGGSGININAVIGGKDRNHFDRSPPRSNELEDSFDGPVLVLPSLRQLTALEDILGSLGPQVNSVMGRALNLEQV